MEFEQAHIVIGNLQIRYYGIIVVVALLCRGLYRFAVNEPQRPRQRSYLGRLNLGDHSGSHRRAPVVCALSARITDRGLWHRR